MYVDTLTVYKNVYLNANLLQNVVHVAHKWQNHVI